MTGLSKALRAVAGIVVLVALVVTVNSLVGQYEAKKRASAEASTAPTPTVESTATTAVRGASLLVVKNVMMRATPSATGAPVRVLHKGEKVVVLGVTAQNWLKVKDPKDKVGYIIKDEHVKKTK